MTNNDSQWILFESKHSKSCRKQNELKKKYPHLISSEKAYTLQHELNINKLGKTLMSKQSMDLQREGWVYYKVLIEDGYENECELNLNGLNNYRILIIPNKWKDQILFINANYNK